MAITKVVMPRLFDARGTIGAWRQQAGDRIQVGDLLVEIETDAADVELEAPAAGVLRAILVPAGDTVPAGALLGVIAEPDDDLTALAPAEASGGSAGDRTPEQPETVSPGPSRREAPGESARALVAASERRCRACGKPLTSRQQGACSAKCRATLSRRSKAAAHQQRDDELREVVAALRRALEALEQRLKASQ